VALVDLEERQQATATLPLHRPRKGQMAAGLVLMVAVAVVAHQRQVLLLQATVRQMAQQAALELHRLFLAAR
jgi:uncharacterized protein YhhL (DUF1145 family)